MINLAIVLTVISVLMAQSHGHHNLIFNFFFFFPGFEGFVLIGTPDSKMNPWGQRSLMRSELKQEWHWSEKAPHNRVQKNKV